MKIELKRVVDHTGEWFGIWKDDLLVIIKDTKEEAMAAVEGMKNYTEPVRTTVAEYGIYRVEKREDHEVAYFVYVKDRAVAFSRDYEEAMGKFNELKSIVPVRETLISIEL